MEKPIIFSTEMVQAIMDGRKTQTRRLIKLPKYIKLQSDGLYILFSDGDCYENQHFEQIIDYLNCTYKVGDILWVRETWCLLHELDGNDQIIEGTEKYYHAADNTDFAFTHFLREDGTYKDYPAWRPSIFMPREAARIFLKVTGVRVGRVQDITEEDSLKEGFRRSDKHAGESSTPALTARQSFMWYWDFLNSKRSYPWALNPWCWVIEFERVEGLK